LFETNAVLSEVLGSLSFAPFKISDLYHDTGIQ
jgi:hypothetical protein